MHDESNAAFQRFVSFDRLTDSSMPPQDEQEGPLRIGFIHPDLGIGGAERLVVDAAVSLQQRGHEVVLFTSRHDPHRCFEETRDGRSHCRSEGVCCR